MASERKKRVKAEPTEAAPKKRTKLEALTPAQLKRQFELVLLHLKDNRAINLTLYQELQKLLDDKLNTVYADVEKLSATVKAVPTPRSAKATTAQPELQTISGSLRSVVSNLVSVNREQKQLFQDMLAAKLFVSLVAGKPVPMDAKTAERFTVKVDLLISNLKNLSQHLARSFRMVHGHNPAVTEYKGLTLEHGKDLPSAYQAALQQECEKLQEVLLQQIELNRRLKEGIRPEEQPRPRSPGGPS